MHDSGLSISQSAYFSSKLFLGILVHIVLPDTKRDDFWPEGYKLAKTCAHELKRLLGVSTTKSIRNRNPGCAWLRPANLARR